MLLLFGSAWPYQQQTPTGVPNSVATATVVVGFWDEMVQSIGVVMKIGIWILISWGLLPTPSIPVLSSAHTSIWFEELQLLWLHDCLLWGINTFRNLTSDLLSAVKRFCHNLMYISHSEIKQVQLIKSMLLLVPLNNLCVLGINHRSIKLKWIDWN